MSDLLNTGAGALSAFRRAIATTSHNIANVNTEGYSRQQVVLEPNAPVRRDAGFVGTGVHVAGVERITSQFATARVQDATANHARESTHHALASRLDNLVADDAMSLGPAIDSFFAAVEDASTDPASATNRELVIAAGDVLASRTNALQGELESTQGEVEARRRASVDTLNDLSTSLADVNRRLVNHRASGRQELASDLLDERDRVVSAMANEADVDVHLQDDGAINVSIGDGVALVIGSQSRALRTASDPVAPGQLGIEVENGIDWQPIASRIKGGALGGLAEFESGTLALAMNRLGQLSHAFAAAVNVQHAAGIDANGDGGGAWFTVDSAAGVSAELNTGTAAVDANVTDATALQASDYLLRFDGGTWEITRESDGVTTSATSLPTNLDGLEITFSGTPASGDRFSVSATRHAAGSLGSVLSDPHGLALSSPIRTESTIDNAGSARLDRLRVTDGTDPALRTPVRIEFTDAATYDVVDETSGTTLATGVTYASGDDVAWNGWAVALSGEARSGDVHRIVPNANGGGDNGNAMQLAELRSVLAIAGSSNTSDAFGTLAAEIGGRTRSLETRADAAAAVQEDAFARRDSISGVNLDEEAIDLARHEQAYQAAARVISTADQLFQTILGAVSR